MGVYYEGQLVFIYSGKHEIGKIKSINWENRTAFVWYHSGETAALTRLKDITAIENSHMIKETLLGGEEGSKL